MKLVKSSIGSLTAIAERLRNGENVNAIATELGIASSTLRARLSEGGWNAAGIPVDVSLPKPSASGPLRTTEWKVNGLCSVVDPEIFYPEKGQSVLAAKRVCQFCPVRERCLEYALDAPEVYGVWGGTSPRERQRIKRRRRGEVVRTTPDEVREWALLEGLPVNGSGVIPAEIRTAYAEAHPDESVA